MPSMWAPSDERFFDAAYYDGKTAVRHSVKVRLGLTSLDVLAQDDHPLDQWNLADVELSDQESGGARVVKRGTEARLVILEEGAFQALKERAPALLTQRRRTWRNIALSFVSAFGIVATTYVSLPAFSTAVVRLVPLESESRLGRSMTANISELFGGSRGTCRSAGADTALELIVTRLSRYSQGPFPYSVEILDTPQANAVALPGGHIFLFRGLLEITESADEVTAVVAHEMAHVNHRHGMQAAIRVIGMNMIADMLLGGGVGGSASSLLLTTSHSREAEQEADREAIMILTNAGVGTSGMARFFRRLKEREDKESFVLPQMLSTHPDNEVRESVALMAEQKDVWRLDADSWAALKAACESE